ncbi:LuxR C-terminal-related transcriptional regulator [Streptomyces sp. NRRL B-24720]|uniref:LuxR C-terminal-related transcriptional regulator n=1 Tax=Streptomyces sp. NRRL B-24720 TaxID=1476876 RepID=UPI003B637B0C
MRRSTSRRARHTRTLSRNTSRTAHPYAGTNRRAAPGSRPGASVASPAGTQTSLTAPVRGPMLGCWGHEGRIGSRWSRRTATGGQGVVVEDRVRVVIAEDSVLLREGLTRLLTDLGHDVVAGVGDAEALIKTVGDLAEGGELPDVVVADVRMPPTHTDEGVRAAVRLRKEYPGIGVLVLSQYVEEQYATELLAGSSRGVGYLLKDRVAEVREFVDAVVRVAQGGTALDPEVVAQLLGRSRKQDVLAGLTPREREVLGLMAEGRTNSAVAKQLVVSDGAVEKHVSNIFLKLGLSPSEGDHRRVLAVLTYLNS